jgi:hypothetical protein
MGFFSRILYSSLTLRLCPKRPSDWRWSGHGEYLGTEKRGLIDSGPVMGELRTAARYEAFIREGAKVNYRAEWHPGDGRRF